MSIWCVRPEEVKVELVYTQKEAGTETPFPFWVKFKKRLTIGEERKVRMSGWKGVRQGEDGSGEIQVNWQAQSFVRTETYLTDWSLSEDDKKLVLSREVLESLSPAVYELIEDALNTHIAAATAEKKVPSGATESASK